MKLKVKEKNEKAGDKGRKSIIRMNTTRG